MASLGSSQNADYSAQEQVFAYEMIWSNAYGVTLSQGRLVSMWIKSTQRLWRSMEFKLQFFATLIYIYIQCVILSRKNEITLRSSSPDVVLIEKYHKSSGKATVQ